MGFFHSTFSLLKSERNLLGFFFLFSVTDLSLALCVDAMQRPLNIDLQSKEMQWLLQ